ncbi:MAG: hypothetical protein COA45_11030 [Zetaproteobacteria bacterium]|nr:MAG: hypothetical protein COA45_11030 [Zetaproteobacteria bacterium]
MPNIYTLSVFIVLIALFPLKKASCQQFIHGIESPNKQKRISIYIFSGPTNGSITLHESQTKTIIAPEFKVNIEFSPWSSMNEPVQPFVWLNNKQIITQKNNGEIYLIGTDSTVTKIVHIPNIEPFISYPKFRKTFFGKIIYETDKRSFYIKVKEKKFVEIIPNTIKNRLFGWLIQKR